MEFGGHVYAPREKGLPKVMAMIEVSGKSGYNVRELRHMIYNIACDIKEKGERNLSKINPGLFSCSFPKIELHFNQPWLEPTPSLAGTLTNLAWNPNQPCLEP